MAGIAAGAAGVGAAVGTRGASAAGAAVRFAVGGNWTVARSGVRTLNTGSRKAAHRAATHTPWRWRAGPLGIRRQARVATAQAMGTCHREFSRKVNSVPLIV